MWIYTDTMPTVNCANSSPLQIPLVMNTMASGFPLSYQRYYDPLSASQSQKPLDIICHLSTVVHLLLGQVLSSTMEPSAQICNQMYHISTRNLMLLQSKVHTPRPASKPLPHLAQSILLLQTQQYCHQVMVCSTAHTCSRVGCFCSVLLSLTQQTSCRSYLSYDTF